jgi:PAS domain S-box
MSSPACTSDSDAPGSSGDRIFVVYIDDEPDFFDLVTRGLKRHDEMMEIETAVGATAGLDIITEQSPDCVISDYDMPTMDGVELLETVREDHPKLPFILYTGEGNEEVASQAMTAEATDYLIKDSGPEHFDHLSTLIRAAVEERREEKIAEKRQELIRRTEIESDAGGFEIDAVEDTTLVTGGACEIFNISNETDLTRDQVIELFDSDDHEAIQQAISRVLTTGETIYRTYTTQSSDDQDRVLQMTFSLKHTGPDAASVQIIIRDITEQHEQEQQIEVFDRVLRHNLRNNLNLIRGAAEMISSEAKQEIIDYSEQIIDESDRLLAAATKQRDIMDILREEPDQETFAVESVLQQVVADMQSKYPQANISVGCPTDLSVEASSRFTQAIEELVENAIEHNDVQPVEVSLSAEQTQDDIQIDVADNGPQIPEMERDVLVKPQERTPLYHGSGLGLWLVKLVISRSNGEIMFEQNSPTGNIISIEIPR